MTLFNIDGIMVLVKVKNTKLFLKPTIHSAGWSSLEARLAHNQEVVGSNPSPAIRSGAENDHRLRGCGVARGRA